MIAERLRKAVLKAAMEGKLTNQLLNDSKTIITIDKKYAQIQQEQIPYTIPENWKWLRVKELFVIRNGFTPLRSNMDFWNSKDVPWFTVNDIRNQGRVITYTDQYISNLAVTDNKVVPKNSILLCCTASIGEYALTKIDLTTNQQFNGMTIKDKYQEFIDIWFVYYWVQTIKEEMISKAGKTTFPFLSVTKLGDFLIPLPPIEEQKRIVEKLEVLLAEIDKLEQDEIALEKLEDKFPERLKSAILQAAIQGRISNQSIDKDNSYNHSGINGNKQITYEENDKTGLVVPTTWRFYKLVDVSDVIGGYAFKSSEYLKSNIENGVRVIRISDFNNDGLIDNSPVYYNEDNKLSRYEIRENDILLCMTGGTVGKNTLVNNIDKKLYLNQRVAAIRNNSPSLLNTEYLHIVLNTPYIQNIINDSKNSTNDNISMRQINNFIIPIPPLKEQIEIINKIKKLSINIETM